MPEPTEAAVLGALEVAIRDHGWLMTRDPARLRGILSDLLGSHGDDHRGALDALVVSAEENVPTLVRDSGRAGLEAARPGLMARLEDWGLSEERAAWVIQAWASLLPESTMPPPAEPAPPPPDAGLTALPPAPPQPAGMPPGRTQPEPTTLPQAALPPAAPDLTALSPDGARPPDDSAPDAPTPTRHARPLWLIAAAVLAVVLVAGGVAVAVVSRHGDDSDGPTKTTANGTHRSSSATTTAGPNATPAAGTELLAAPDLRPTRAFGTFAMASKSGGVRISQLQQVDQVRSGTTLVGPPAGGGRLVGFTLTNWTCDDTHCADWTTLGLTVQVGADQRPLPDTQGTYVVAVPGDQTDAELTMTADGHTQTLSLLTGDPGADNIAVLARPKRRVAIDTQFQLTETTSIPLIYNDGVSRTRAIDTVTIGTAALHYFTGIGEPARPQMAYLRIGATFKRPYPGEEVYVVDRRYLRFRGLDGTVYDAIDLRDTGTGSVEVRADGVFEVPADIQGGTLLLGGIVEVHQDPNYDFTDTFSDKAVPIQFS